MSADHLRALSWNPQCIQVGQAHHKKNNSLFVCRTHIHRGTNLDCVTAVVHHWLEWIFCIHCDLFGNWQFSLWSGCGPFSHWQQEADNQPAVWDATFCLTLQTTNQQRKKKKKMETCYRTYPCAFSHFHAFFVTFFPTNSGHTLTITAIQHCIVRPLVAEIRHHCSSSPEKEFGATWRITVLH